MPTRHLLPWSGYLGWLMKDIASGFAKRAHRMTSASDLFPVCRHQNIRVYRGALPTTEGSAYIAPSASVIGNVIVGHDSAVWYHAAVRNLNLREEAIVGDHSTIMDRATLIGAVQVGSGVYVGHGASLDCCTICDGAYIGPGATICLGSVVENGAIVAAGAVVAKDTRVGAGELWAGNPAQKVAEVTTEQASDVQHVVHDQIRYAKAHRSAFEQHVKLTEDLSAEWLLAAVEQMEEQQRSVAIKPPSEIPVEALPYLQPRMQLRHSTGTYANSNHNRAAPWLLRPPEWTGNT